MKTRRTLKKSPADLMGRLTAYSATAAAAMLAATPARATITNISSLTLNGSSVSSIDINFFHADTNPTIGIGAYTFHLGLSNSVSNAWGEVFLARGRLAFDGSINVLNLGYSAAIKGRSFTNFADFATVIGGPHPRKGQFLPAVANGTKTGYAEFKNGTIYGWFRVKVTNDSRNAPMEFAILPSKNDPSVFGAFDQSADVTADGFKVGIAAPVPEPTSAALTSLGLLACGAAGVREFRKRRSAAMA